MKRPMTQAEYDAFIAKGNTVTRCHLGESGMPEYSATWRRRLTTKTPTADANAAATVKESKQ